MALFGLLKSKPLIDPDELEWLFATVRWLIELSPEAFDPAVRPLISPSTDHFPASRLSGDARAQQLFQQVVTHSDMSAFELVLQPGQSARQPVLGGGLQHSFEDKTAAGTFQPALDRQTGHAVSLIRYNPDLLGDPVSLVATFAHELAHVRLHAARCDPPGGPELEELATDLAAVFMGFGIFLANSAKSFSAFQSFDSSGWQSRRQGYLGERMLVTALALFELLGEREPLDAKLWLKSYLASDLKRASAYFADHHADVRADVMRATWVAG